MQIEQEISQNMRNYVDSVLSYNNTIEDELKLWEEFLEEFQKFPEFIEIANNNYALLFAEGKQYNNSLVPEVRDIEMYATEALEESEMAMIFSRMNKTELLQVLGNLQEIQKLKVQQLEGDKSISLENEINALFLDMKVRFKVSLHPFSLGDIHNLTDKVKDLIRLKTENPHAIIRPKKGIAQNSLAIFMDQKTGDIHLLANKENIKNLLQKEEEVFFEIEVSLLEYIEALEKQLGTLRKKNIEKSFDRVEKAYEKLQVDLTRIAALALVKRHEERALVIQTQLELFLGDIENGLLEQQQINQAWKKVDRFSCFQEIQEQLALIISEWKRFRNPLKTTKEDIENIKNHFNRVPIDKTLSGLVQQKNLVLESQHLITVVKSLTSKIYSKFVATASENAKEMHRELAQDLESILVSQPSIMEIPHIFAFPGTASEPPPNKNLAVGEQITNVRIYNKKIMDIDEKNFMFDYSYVPTVQRILDVDFEMGIVGFTNHGNTIDLKPQRLLEKNPASIEETSFSGFVQEEYEVKWKEKVERTYQVERVVNGKTRKFVSKRIELIDKTERILNQLEIWNLTAIRAEVVEQVGSEEIDENHFAMLGGQVEGEQVQSNLVSGKNKLRLRFFGTFQNSAKEMEILLQRENLNIRLENKFVTFEGKSDIVVEKLKESSTLTVSVKGCPHVKPLEIKIDVLPIHLEAKNIEDNEFEIRAFNKEGKFTETTQILWKSADFVQSGTTTPLGTVGNWKMPPSTTVAVVEIISDDIKIVAEITVAEERKTISDIIRLPRKKEGQVLIMATRNYEMEIAQTGRLEGIAGENTRLNARLVYTYNVPPFDSSRHQILQWDGFPSRRVVVKDETSTFLNNLKIKWSSGNGGSFSPQITSFHKEQNGEWHATTEWRAGEKGLEAVTMELVGTLSNLQEQQISNEDRLRLQQQEQELKSQLQQQHKIFVEELANIVNNLRSAINGNRAENERIRQDNEEKEKRIQEQIEEQQRKAQEAIALLESKLREFEAQEGGLQAEEKALENITKELEEFFIEDIESEHVDLDKIDIRIDADFFDKLLANAKDDFEREFIIKNMELLKKEEKKRISDEKIANLPPNHVVEGLNQLAIILMTVTELRTEIFENASALPSAILSEIGEEVMSVVRDAPALIMSGIFSLDIELIVNGLLRFVAVLKVFRKMAKIIKKLNSMANKALKAREKFEEVKGKVEEAQDLIETLQSGDLLELAQGIDLKKDKNKRKNDDEKNNKIQDDDDTEEKNEVKTSNKKFDHPNDKKRAKEILDESIKKLSKKLKTEIEGAKEKALETKNDLIQVSANKKKAKQELEKAKKVTGCFTAETLVHTTTGIKPIKNIKQGDKVYGTYINKNKFTTTNSFVLSTTRKIVFTLIILFLGNNSIETTPEHPFWIVNKGWTEAKDIQEGDLVQTINNEQITIERIERRRGQFEVYNLDVADCDTFFVDQMGVLVHNANKCGETRPPEEGDLNKENTTRKFKIIQGEPKKGNEILSSNIAEIIDLRFAKFLQVKFKDNSRKRNPANWKQIEEEWKISGGKLIRIYWQFKDDKIKFFAPDLQEEIKLCFVKGTKVYSHQNYTNIEDIAIGNAVFSK